MAQSSCNERDAPPQFCETGSVKCFNLVAGDLTESDNRLLPPPPPAHFSPPPSREATEQIAKIDWADQFAAHRLARRLQGELSLLGISSIANSTSYLGSYLDTKSLVTRMQVQLVKLECSFNGLDPEVKRELLADPVYRYIKELLLATSRAFGRCDQSELKNLAGEWTRVAMQIEEGPDSWALDTKEELQARAARILATIKARYQHDRSGSDHGAAEVRCSSASGRPAAKLASMGVKPGEQSAPESSATLESIPNPSAPTTLKVIAAAMGGDMNARKLRTLIGKKISGRSLNRQTWIVSLDGFNEAARKKLAQTDTD